MELEFYNSCHTQKFQMYLRRKNKSPHDKTLEERVVNPYDLGLDKGLFDACEAQSIKEENKLDLIKINTSIL